LNNGLALFAAQVALILIRDLNRHILGGSHSGAAEEHGEGSAHGNTHGSVSSGGHFASSGTHRVLYGCMAACLLLAAACCMLWDLLRWLLLR
jgi:hypothetical protein